MKEEGRVRLKRVPTLAKAVMMSFGGAFCVVVLAMLGTHFFGASESTLAPSFARRVFTVSFFTFIFGYAVWRIYESKRSQSKGSGFKS
jgi:hypothetical protein